jgi:ribosomal protein S8
MSMNDPVGDLLSRIRNAQMRNKSKVSSPGSKLRESVLEVLKNEGYIRGYAVVERDGYAEIEIELKYFEGEPVIREIERIPSPAAASIPRSRICRASTTASVLPSSRRRRASWRITPPATPMSAAKFSARYSDRRRDEKRKRNG